MTNSDRMAVFHENV